MKEPGNERPSFNLWTEPWIAAEMPDGTVTQLGIRDLLLRAQTCAGLHDSSPLVVVGLHRLLTAILQDAVDPQENRDLEDLWRQGSFPAEKVKRFGAQYADRFDLFSPDRPFLQSADLPLFPGSRQEIRETTTVARLFPETPSGSLLTHYRHVTEDEQVFAPAAAALGLAAMPAFVSSGGPGLMPSINGVPPIYVLPGGRSLFEALTASLISAQMLADDYPGRKDDLAWWRRPVPVEVVQSKKKKRDMTVAESKQWTEVGYLHGLTFPARKVRLHPERVWATCTRSGQMSEWCVRTMTFRMGESLVEDAPLWRDPFAAYRLPQPSGKPKTRRASRTPVSSKPSPIRPNIQRGIAAWREFSGLFLQYRADVQRALRPRFLDQLSLLSIGEALDAYPFRCVALQTDGKMKFFEWIDFGFDVPPALLSDPEGAEWTERALLFSSECAGAAIAVFATALGRQARNRERFRRLKERLEADFWEESAGEFRRFVLDLDQTGERPQKLAAWIEATASRALAAFGRAADATGDDGTSLRRIVEGKERCWRALADLRRRYSQGG